VLAVIVKMVGYQFFHQPEVQAARKMPVDW
jgi:hypothetical protein